MDQLETPGEHHVTLFQQVHSVVHDNILHAARLRGNKSICVILALQVFVRRTLAVLLETIPSLA